MDRAELQVAVIQTSLDTTARIVDLQARRHVAVLAVALAAAVSAILAGLAAQVPIEAAVAIATGLGAVAATQVRALGRLIRLLRRSSAEAVRDLREVKTLISQEGETGVDDPAQDQG